MNQTKWKSCRFPPGSDQSSAAFVHCRCTGMAFRLYQQETFFYLTLHNVVTNKQWKFNFLRQPPSTGENKRLFTQKRWYQLNHFAELCSGKHHNGGFFPPFLLAFICDSGRKHSYWGGWEGGNIFLIQLNLQHVAFGSPSTGSPNKRSEFYLFCMLFALTNEKFPSRFSKAEH